MVIAFCIKDFALGGGSRAMYQLCLSLPEVKFYIFGKAGLMAADFSELSNVTIHYVGGWNCWEYARVLRKCQSLGVDLIHFHSLIPALYSVIFRSEKVIYTFHGIHYRKYDFLPSKIMKFVRLALMWLLVNRMQGIITLCDDDDKYLKKLFGNGILEKKMRVIPNAIKIPVCNDRYTFFSDMINLLVVARYDFPKGLDILLDLLRNMNNVNVKFKIYFIGDDEVRNLIEENKDIKCVEFLAKTNKPYKYMQAADFLLLPSRWEGLPMVVLEALALGTKVIAADTANVNYMADNKSVFIYRQFDADSFTETLQTAFEHKDEVVDIDLSSFSAVNVGNKTREFYSKIVGR